MSFNQSRAERSESSQYRKSGRSGRSTQPRNFSGCSGKGGGTAPPSSSSVNPASSSLTSKRSFKKSYNAQGGQSRVSGGNVNSDSNNASSARTLQNGSHWQPAVRAADAPVTGVTVKSTSDMANQKSAPAVPSALSIQTATNSSDTTASATPTKGDASRSVPLQFGSISPGFMNGMQIPARTNSAPPNLDEQKRDQARHDSSRVVSAFPIPSVPKQQMPRKDGGAGDQSNIGDAHQVSKARRDAQISNAPPIAQTQKASGHSFPGISMAMPFHQPQVPVQFGFPNPQIQSQGMTSISLPMPMPLPLPMGNAQLQQQVFVSGLPPHPIHPQGIMHQGQSLNFTPQMGPQLPPQMGNMGISISQQFAQQQAGKLGGPRKPVKITHPDMHEELRLHRRVDTSTDGGRSHPNVPQSQPITSVPAPHSINHYPNSHNPKPLYFPGPGSVPLTNSPINPSSQAPRISFPVSQGPPTVSFMNPSVVTKSVLSDEREAPVSTTASVSEPSLKHEWAGSEDTHSGFISPPAAGSKDKPVIELTRSKSSRPRGKKKRKEILRKAAAARTTSLWEDAAVISTPKFETVDDGKLGGPRKPVKITHPDMHEELRLHRRVDTSTDGGRSHPNVPQSQPITSVPAPHSINHYPNSHNPKPLCFPGPGSVPSTNSPINPSSQAPRISFPVSQGPPTVSFMNPSVVTKSVLSDEREAPVSTTASVSEPSLKHEWAGSEDTHSGFISPPAAGSENKPVIELTRSKSSGPRGKKKRKEILRKAAAARTTSEWEDAAVISTPKLETVDDGKLEGPRKPVKITHPDMHEELRLHRRVDTSTDGGRSHPNVPQSQPITSVPAPHSISHYPNSHNPNPLYFPGPGSVRLTNSPINPSSQAPRISFPVSQGPPTVSFMNPSVVTKSVLSDEREAPVSTTASVSEPSLKHEWAGSEDTHSDFISPPAAGSKDKPVIELTRSKSSGPRGKKKRKEILRKAAGARTTSEWEDAAVISTPKFETVDDGKLGGPRKPVKITHPDMHEELRLHRRVDTSTDGGRSHPNVPQSQPITSVPAPHSINHYPNSHNPNPLYFPGPGSVPLTNSPINPSSQAPRISFPVSQGPPTVSFMNPSVVTKSVLSDEREAPVSTTASVSEPSLKHEWAGSEDTHSDFISPPAAGSKDKPVIELTRSKSSGPRGKKKRKEILRKAAAARTTSDWEDAAVISTPKLETVDDGKQVHGRMKHLGEDGNGATDKRYSRDFPLKFSDLCTELLESFEISSDIAQALMVSNVNASLESYPSPRRSIDRPSGGSHCGVGMGDDEKWSKLPGPLVTGRDLCLDGYGGNFRPDQGGNYGVLRNPRVQTPQFPGGILSGPMQSLGYHGGIQRNSPDLERWKRATAFQKGLIPSPQTPLQVMHKAEKKYEMGKVTDKEEAKQRQLKAILNKLRPQNFEKLFRQVKAVKIDSAVTLTGLTSQIFDKALMEPTFCEMYANFCFHLAGELPDFSEDNEKITFKRLLLNKCQEEFERGEREQEEADRADQEGDVEQSEEEREEKRIRVQRRMLGNISLIGELYKKKMLTERTMHECIKKLLGQYQNPDEENIEALCTLMSTIGVMIDHPKAKEHMDAYFDMMTRLSNNMKLSSRVRFMLKDAIDLRKNKWQQRRKVEGPKKIEEVCSDAAQEQQVQAGWLARSPSMNSSVRNRQPADFVSRGSSMLTPNAQTGNFRGLPTQPRSFENQDFHSGPMQSLGYHGGMQRNSPDLERWQNATAFQKGLIPSPQTPLQVMHKAEKKYETGEVTDKEEAKQRQLKAILNKLRPQNFEKLFRQVKAVKIDSAVTLAGLTSQIFDKALMEPTFCEMYANFCFHLAGELPDFSEDNEKITFKRLLLNKCQEEFERGEREQEEADRADQEGDVEQSEEEREEKRIRVQRRMLGNISLIGELYKKKMLTERTMHECIKKLLGQYQNPDEENIEALCTLMSTIGVMIDHPKAKEHMDAYFDMMTRLSNNMKLSSRVRFMLKDAIDLRKNKWQQRRKVEGPKKIEEVCSDAAQERQVQAGWLARGPGMNSSVRNCQPADFVSRGSSMLTANAQTGSYRRLPTQPRSFENQDFCLDEGHSFDNGTSSAPLPQRTSGEDSITLGPQENNTSEHFQLQWYLCLFLLTFLFFYKFSC